MKIENFMTKNVVSLTKNYTILDCVNLMSIENIGSIPIVNQQNLLIGIITDRDIITKIVYTKKVLNTPIEDIMTKNVFSLKDDDDVDSVISLMSTKQIRRIPIVNNDDELVGIISLGDLATDFHTRQNSLEALKNISLPSTDDYPSVPAP